MFHWIDTSCHEILCDLIPDFPVGMRLDEANSVQDTHSFTIVLCVKPLHLGYNLCCFVLFFHQSCWARAGRHLSRNLYYIVGRRQPGAEVLNHDMQHRRPLPG